MITVALVAAAQAGTIADAKLAGDGAVVTIDSAIVISTYDSVNRQNSCSMQIRDDSGAITLYGSQTAMDAFAASFPVGSWISLTDVTVDLFSGLWELTASDWATGFQGDVGTADPIPGIDAAPYVITPGDFAGETYQSELVTLEGVSFPGAGGTFAYGNLDLTWDGGTYPGRVPTQYPDRTPILGTDIPAGEWDVTGVLSTFTTNQLLLHDPDNIVPEPASLVLIGLGFEAARRPGSQVHDAIYYDATQRDTATFGFVRRTNRAGGLEAGMSDGQTIVVRGAMKPIATLMQGMDSVNLKTRQPERSDYERSDVCAVPAASVVAENVVAFEIARALREKFGGDTLGEMRAAYAHYGQAVRALGDAGG
jgi:hypothetical protein